MLGWTTSNFYNTNFRAHQPGRVRARYHLRPHEGSFEESRAHRAGLAAEHHEPLVQPLAEGRPGSDRLPETGTFLDLPHPPVLVINVRPEGDAGTILPMNEGGRSDGRIDVTLLNASDAPRTAAVGSGVLSIESARAVDVLGVHEGADLPVEGGIVERELGPREMVTIRLECGN